jgi:histidinol-phosphate phosphatase family protein
MIPATNSPVVILDRDGTIIADAHYLRDPNHIQLLPGAVEGLQRLTELGLQLLLVTNQSGVGRGFFSMREVEAVHEELRKRLFHHGIQLRGIFVCPHSPDQGCECRKPKTGLVKDAVQSLCLRLERVYVIGDRSCDIDLSHNLGATALWVSNATHHDEVAQSARGPHFTVNNLLEAAMVIEDELTDFRAPTLANQF